MLFYFSKYIYGFKARAYSTSIYEAPNNCPNQYEDCTTDCLGHQPHMSLDPYN